MKTTSSIPATVNGVAIDELSKTVENIKATPSIAKFGFRVRNQWVEGARNNSTVNAYHGAGQEISRTKPFVLEADEPPVLLGKDTAANPVEHLLHALAACLTTSMVYHAAVLGILIEKVDVVPGRRYRPARISGTRPECAPGIPGIRVHFKIRADVPDEELQNIGQLGPKYSPVFDSLTKGVPVSVTAERL